MPEICMKLFSLEEKNIISTDETYMDLHGGHTLKFLFTSFLIPTVEKHDLNINLIKFLPEVRQGVFSLRVISIYLSKSICFCFFHVDVVILYRTL